MGERGDCHNLVFSVQIGLEREAVTVALGGTAEFTMSTLTEIACAFVDRKVTVVAITLTAFEHPLLILLVSGGHFPD